MEDYTKEAQEKCCDKCKLVNAGINCCLGRCLCHHKLNLEWDLWVDEKLFSENVFYEDENSTVRVRDLSATLKSAILDLLTEARKRFRKEWLEEEITELKKGLSGQKNDNGHDCYDYACRYCENRTIDATLEDEICRLEAELKALTK